MQVMDVQHAVNLQRGGGRTVLGPECAERGFPSIPSSLHRQMGPPHMVPPS